LRNFGTFDEVSVGRNWLNTAIVLYIWDRSADSAGMPQLVLVEHHVRSTTKQIAVGRDSIIRRWYGARAIDPAIPPRKRSDPGAAVTSKAGVAG
jgi:hypothetical protein